MHFFRCISYLILLLGGCTFARTQTVVDVHADATVRTRATAIRVEVRRGESVLFAEEISPQSQSFVGFPLSFPISATDGDAERSFVFRVSAVETRTAADGTVTTTPLASNQLQSGFVRGEVRHVALWLLRGCSCAQNQRCVPDATGDDIPECAPIKIDLNEQVNRDASFDSAMDADLDASIHGAADARNENEVGAVTPDATIDTGADACIPTIRTLTRKPSVLMFVVDTTGSMLCSPGLSSDECQTRQTCVTSMDAAACDAQYADSKWSSLRSTLSAMLPTIPDDAFLGLSNFLTLTGTPPNYMQVCPAPIQVMMGPVTTTRSQAQTTLTNLHPIGSSPLSAAVLQAITALRAHNGSNVDRYLVLPTDGTPNCTANCSCSTASIATDNADTRSLVQSVQTAGAEGIRTYVIGLPGSSSWTSVFTEFASVSRGRYFDLSNSTVALSSDLNATFDDVKRSTTSCSFPLPSLASVELARVEVRYRTAQGQTTIPRGTNGWRFNDTASPTHIEVFGAACDATRNAERVELYVACATE